MSRKIIIEGTSVYELDENCMLRKKSRADESGAKDADRNVAEKRMRNKTDSIPKE